MHADLANLRATGRLPSPKGLALQIMRLCSDENVSLGRVVDAVRRDPACVARLIQAANGLLSTHERRVASPQDALRVLGLAAVRGLVLGLSFADRAAPWYRSLDFNSFWTRSVLRGIAMQRLAYHLRLADSQELFTVGLLARIGVLAAAAAGPQFSDGTALSAALLREWQFPEVFVTATAHFSLSQLDTAPGTRVRQIAVALALADALAQSCAAPDGARPATLRPAVTLARALEVGPSLLSSVITRVLSDWQTWARLLDLPDIQDASVQDTPLSGRVRALVIDDEESQRLVLSAILRRHGYEVLDARDGRDGLDRAAESVPDVVLVDWLMPGMDGIDFVRSLRATQAGQRTYVLMVTGLAHEPGRLVEAFDAGVNDFLPKPINEIELRARLRAAELVVRMRELLERDPHDARLQVVELQAAHRQLTQDSLTDPLTRAWNFGGAEKLLVSEFAHAIRTGHPLSVLTIDLDEFKRVNDTWGHATGDACLIAVANAMTRVVRTHDAICRRGGDEFIVICPGADLDGAMVTGDRLRAAVAATPFATPNGPSLITVSVGAAQLTAAMQSHAALLAASDAAAYAAKKAGRNRVFCAVQGQTQL